MTEIYIRTGTTDQLKRGEALLYELYYGKSLATTTAWGRRHIKSSLGFHYRYANASLEEGSHVYKSLLISLGYFGSNLK